MGVTLGNGARSQSTPELQQSIPINQEAKFYDLTVQEMAVVYEQDRKNVRVI